jgi:hypothetical protein
MICDRSTPPPAARTFNCSLSTHASVDMDGAKPIILTPNELLVLARHHRLTAASLRAQAARARLHQNPPKGFIKRTALDLQQLARQTDDRAHEFVSIVKSSILNLQQ